MNANNIATENRLAVFTAPRQVELQTEPLPELVRGEALVQIRACALCTMEQRLWTGAQHEYPIVPGHETAGEIVACHPKGVVGLAPGMRVAIAFLDRCMQCDACRRGESNLCTGKMQGRAPNVFRRIGGLSDYAVVPAWKLFPMPQNNSFDELALCEPVACVVHSIDRVQLKLGNDVLVVGCGTMGQLHILLARLRGTRVLVSDPDPQKRQFAITNGAQAAFDPAEVASGIQDLTNARGVDAVFVCFGNENAADQAAAAVRPGGYIVYYANFPDNITTGITARRLHRDEIVVTGARGQTLDDWHQATRLIAGGLIDVRPLISSRYPLNKIADALDQACDRTSYRVVVNP